MERTFTTSEIKEKLFPIFNSTPIEKAVLFGSYARGNPISKSDVDILIDSKGKIKGIDFFGVLDAVVETLRVPVDLIEASQVIEGGKVAREIAETGVTIYEKA
jgi:hypothetical protein